MGTLFEANTEDHPMTKVSDCVMWRCLLNLFSMWDFRKTRPSLLDSTLELQLIVCWKQHQS